MRRKYLFRIKRFFKQKMKGNKMNEFEVIALINGEKIIGEYYHKIKYGYDNDFYWCWGKFKYSDLDFNKNHDDYIYIKDQCINKKFIIFYDDIYKSIRKKIETIVNKEAKENE